MSSRRVKNAFNAWLQVQAKKDVVSSTKAVQVFLIVASGSERKEFRELVDAHKTSQAEA